MSTILDVFAISASSSLCDDTTSLSVIILVLAAFTILDLIESLSEHADRS